MTSPTDRPAPAPDQSRATLDRVLDALNESLDPAPKSMWCYTAFYADIPALLSKLRDVVGVDTFAARAALGLVIAEVMVRFEHWRKLESLAESEDARARRSAVRLELGDLLIRLTSVGFENMAVPGLAEERALSAPPQAAAESSAKPGTIEAREEHFTRIDRATAFAEAARMARERVPSRDNAHSRADELLRSSEQLAARDRRVEELEAQIEEMYLARARAALADGRETK